MECDLEIVRRCQNGDDTAFRQLVERYEERIYTLACGIIGESEAARDMAQEIFIRAYQGLSGFRRASKFYTWLYRIAVNVCLNAVDKQKRRLDSISLDALQESGKIPPEQLFGATLPETDIERMELQNQILTVISNLSPDHRAVIFLKDLEDRSQEEIAETLGCSIGTVKSRLFRARAQMRDLLRPLYNEWRGKEPE